MHFFLHASRIIMDFYETLNSDPQDSHGAIKESYQQLLLLHHPDKNGGQESERFLKIVEAWRTLGSIQSRQEYDAQLKCHSNEEEDAMVWKELRLQDMTDNESYWCDDCRCGGEFILTRDECEELSKEDQYILVNCDTCSFCLKIDIGAS